MKEETKQKECEIDFLLSVQFSLANFSAVSASELFCGFLVIIRQISNPVKVF